MSPEKVFVIWNAHNENVVSVFANESKCLVELDNLNDEWCKKYGADWGPFYYDEFEVDYGT